MLASVTRLRVRSVRFLPPFAQPRLRPLIGQDLKPRKSASRESCLRTNRGVLFGSLYQRAVDASNDPTPGL